MGGGGREGVGFDVRGSWVDSALVCVPKLHLWGGGGEREGVSFN